MAKSEAGLTGRENKQELKSGRKGLRSKGGGGGLKRPATQLHSQQYGKKERYTEIEKDKSPESKDRWDNLN